MKSEKITAEQFVLDYVHGYALHRINRENDGNPKHFIQISTNEWVDDIYDRYQIKNTSWRE